MKIVTRKKENDNNNNNNNNDANQYRQILTNLGLIDSLN